jgi:hypothetical protein
MIIQLLKNGVPVFTARSEHTKDNAGSDLPITYEGDLSLYPNLWEEASVDMLEGYLSRVADEKGFELAGDYHPMIRKGEIVLPPPGHPWWKR